MTVYAGQETPTADYLDSSNNERLQRSQYAIHGYYFMSRAEYLALKDVSSVRTYNAANSSQYKNSETMPPENRMAVAIWTLNQPAFGTVRLDVYLQKKTDNKDATDPQKQYDFLGTYTLEDPIPVGQTYNNSNSSGLRGKIDEKIKNLKAELKSTQSITLTETFGSGSFFQRNAANSDLDKVIVPGEFTAEGDNVIKIMYDRAKFRIIFGGVSGSGVSGGSKYYLVKNPTNSEWQFKTEDQLRQMGVSVSQADQFVEGLYQSPLKTSSGERFTWPQDIRFYTNSTTQLTFLTYFNPATTTDPKWSAADNRFNYYMYNGKTNNATNNLNYYTEKLGVRLSTDTEPTYSTVQDANYTPPGTPPSFTVKLNGTFSLSDKFDGYKVFAYRTTSTGRLQDGKPGGSFKTGISFSNGGRIYAQRIIYNIGYDNAIGMLANQPSTTNRSAAQNYYNYPIKRLYEEELEQLPKLTNDNYPEGDADYTFAGWSTVLDFYDKESYVTNGDGQFVTYQDGQLVPDAEKRTMPSNGLNYIAMWSSEKNVQLMAPAAGTANSKNMRWEQLTTAAPITVQKYTALTGDHNGYAFAKDGSITRKVYDGKGKEVSGKIENVMDSLLYRFRVPEDIASEDLEIHWYLDEKCVMEFDPNRDLVIEDNMKLYANLRPDQREQEYTLHYIRSTPDSNGNTVYLHEDETCWGIVDNSLVDPPEYQSFNKDGKVYTLSGGDLSGQKLTQSMVDNDIYYVYSETEVEPWNFTVCDWLDVGGGVYVRLGQTEYTDILERRIVFFPDELRGFKLSASYEELLVEPDVDDGLYTVKGKSKTLNVIYELDETQMSFLGGTFSASAIANAPVTSGGQLAVYRPEALGMATNPDGTLTPLLLGEYLRMGEHLKGTYVENSAERMSLREEWQSGGWQWLWERPETDSDGNPIFNMDNLSKTAYALYVDYVYTGVSGTTTCTVCYSKSGDTDSALSVSRTESGSLPSAAGRYSVSAEIYAQIPGNAATKAKLYAFPAVTMDLDA